MLVGYMKCLLSLTCSVWCSLSVRTTLQSVPKYLVWFMLRLTELHRTKLWCWVVIKAVGCMRFLFRHNRSVWRWILITLQFKAEELSDLLTTQQQTCRFVLMLILLELFSISWTHKIHYKLHQSRLQNFDDGGLLSGWSFVRWFFVRTPPAGDALLECAECVETPT